MSKTIERLSVRVLVLVTLFVLLGFVRTYATEVTPATGKVNSSNGIIMRESPSTDADEVTRLDNNTNLIIYREVFVTDNKTDSKNIWLYVKVGGKKGYIRSDLVDNISYSPTVAKTTSKVNYREGPGSKMEKKGTYKKSQDLIIVMRAQNQDDEKFWYKVKGGSGYNYLSSSWAKIASASTKITMADVTGPENMPEGGTFIGSGMVLCNESITSVKVGIVNSSGKWLYSASQKVNSTAFDITQISSKLKFSKLAVGTYTYKVIVTVKGKDYTKVKKEFKVKKAANAEKITNKAFELAWPVGTSSGTYSYSSGSAKPEYKQALDDVYPNRSSWGVPPRAGASCDVFVGTVLRASGVDKNAPRGLAEQLKYFPASSKYKRIDYTGDQSMLKSGDVLLFQRKGKSNSHICIYLEKNGTKYVAEANYNRTYGYVTNNKSTVNSKIQASDKAKMYVYRIVEN